MSVFLLLSVLESFHFLIIFVVIPRLSSLKYDSKSTTVEKYRFSTYSLLMIIYVISVIKNSWKIEILKNYPFNSKMNETSPSDVR